MDSLTHLVAGALTPLAFRHMPRRGAIVAFGILAGELPDIDVLLGGTASAEALFTIHRGITHALVLQPVLALALVLPMYLYMSSRGSRGAPSLGSMFGAALLGLYLHLYLDCMTTFGTQIFLPFSDYRVALPAMFIVDLLCTLPAAALLCLALTSPPEAGMRGPEYGARARRYARLGLGWLVVYPLLALGTQGVVGLKTQAGLAPGEEARILTEPFSPFAWKRIVDDGATVRIATDYLWKPDAEEPDAVYTKAALLPEVAAHNPLVARFAAFAGPVVQVEHPAGADGIRQVDFMGERYVFSPESPARFFGRSDPNFVMQVRLSSEGKLLEYRFLRRGRNTEPWIPAGRR